MSSAARLERRLRTRCSGLLNGHGLPRGCPLGGLVDGGPTRHRPSTARSRPFSHIGSAKVAPGPVPRSEEPAEQSADSGEQAPDQADDPSQQTADRTHEAAKHTHGSLPSAPLRTVLRGPTSAAGTSRLALGPRGALAGQFREALKNPPADLVKPSLGLVTSSRLHSQVPSRPMHSVAAGRMEHVLAAGRMEHVFPSRFVLKLEACDLMALIFRNRTPIT